MSPPLAVSPESAFIAFSAASQIVTNDHDSHADTWYDQHGFQPSGETVLVSNAALRLLNNFLDHLLFNFLAVSGSTCLAKLRPAVIEVLKPKLAKDAINNADEELREYLGGGDDEEFLQSAPSPSPKDWDLELVWKRTRLRCMVYSSLGDMEEEDEDHHMEEGLLGDDDVSGDNVSPAVAIFLTSILEYLGEQALISAGQAAWNRLRIKYEKEAKDITKGHSDVVDRIVVEDLDMERVALDRTLGRLWRAWKKRVRSGPGSVDLSHRPASSETYQVRLSHLSGHDGTVPPAVEESMNEPADGLQKKQEVDDDERAAAIPLPMSERDVDEIEVPGLVFYSDDESSEEEVDELDLGTRPKSLMILPFTSKDEPPTPSASQPQTPTFVARRRANSLPTPAASPYEQRKKANLEDVATDEPAPVGESAVPLGGEEQSAAAETTPYETADEARDDEVHEANAEKSKNETYVVGAVVGAGAAVAAASGAAVAYALGTSKKRAGSQDDTGDDTDFEEIEEAQILTSSRVSVGGSTSGRSDSPANSVRSTRPPLSLHTLPVRSGSLRVVDVASPRTPSMRSQRSSLMQENGGSNSRSASRTSSIHTQPNVEEPREVEDTRALRTTGTAALGAVRSNITPSISEAEEVDEVDEVDEIIARPALSATLPSNVGPRRDPASAPEDRVILTPDDYGHQEEKKSRRQPTQPIFGSVKRQSPSAPSPSQRSLTGPLDLPQSQPSPKLRSAVSGTPPDSGTFLEDDVGPLPQRYPRQNPRQYGASSSPTGSGPVIPEQSSGRAPHNYSRSGGGQPGTIGIVSVDRTPTPKANGDASRTSADQSTIRAFHTPSASSTSSHKVRGARGSQDSTATRPEDVARNFEDLIQSDETIQYTLTPETMREIEVCALMSHVKTYVAPNEMLTPRKGSPRSLGSQGQTRRSEDARQAARDRAGSVKQPVRPIEVRRSASITRATGLRSHPVEITPEERPRPPVSMANRSRGAPQAREATIPRESVLEFAEFIRATGPSGAQAPAVQPNLGPRRNQSVRTGPSVAAPVTRSKASVSVDQGRPSMAGSVSRARLQARDATVDNKDDNSDLIDFIRRGPPNSGNPRIPRTVAPFRTTMDSDQMSAAVGGRAMDAQLPEHDMRYSAASTNVTEMSAPSVQSSVNSQSALLGRKHGGAQNSPLEDQDMMPVRKQRRVRDPYALDFSDEEDDDDFALEPAPQRKAPPKEESLMDFLKSAPPPAPSDPVPFNLSSSQSVPSKVQAPKKKASAPSLMSRFRQNSAATSSNGSRGPRSPTSARSLSSRAGPPSVASNKGYIPIQVNIPTGGDLYPGYGSSAVPAVPSMPAQYASQRPSGRVPMKRFEPRDAVSVPSRGTSDLADFLKNSEPPGASPSWDADPPVDNNSSKLFGRRKKSTGFA